MAKPKTKKSSPPRGATKQGKRQVLGTVPVNYPILRAKLADKEKLLELVADLRRKYPSCPRVRNRVKKLLQIASADVTTPSLSDDVTVLTEGALDLPPVPRSGSQVIERKVRIFKQANAGTTITGFYAPLTTTDMNPFTQGYARLKQVESWTIPRDDGKGNVEMSSVQVLHQEGASGTEVMPTWSTNWTRVGQGYSGIKTDFPLGDFPLFPTGSTVNLVNHFVGIGGSGASATDFLWVVFDVVLECLI